MNKIDTVFPIVKWLWSGVVLVAVSVCSVIFYLKMDSELIKKDLEEKTRIDKEQSNQLREQSQLLRDIHTQQLRASDALNNLEKSITPSLESMNRSIDHAHKRIDDLIRKSGG